MKKNTKKALVFAMIAWVIIGIINVSTLGLLAFIHIDTITLALLVYIATKLTVEDEKNEL